MLGKVAVLSAILTVASLGGDISICPNNAQSCVYTLSFEAAAAVFWVSLIATAVSGVGYVIAWRSRLKTLPASALQALSPVTFNCPHCGASITAPPAQGSVRCGYCGASVLIPMEPGLLIPISAVPASKPADTGKTCDVCGKSLAKDQINIFDSTFRGSRKTGEKIILCRDHLVSKFSEYVLSYGYRAVVVYPMDRRGRIHANAYQFYPLDSMKELRWSQDYIDGLEALLPSGQSMCQNCGRSKAVFSWCSPDIYSNNYSSNKLQDRSRFELQVLCKDCLVKKFSDRLLELNLWFDELNPPVDSDGFSTSFEI